MFRFNLIRYLLSGTCLLSLASSIILGSYFCQNRSKVADISGGYTYKILVCHGAEVYVNKTEFLFFWILPVLFFTGFLILLFMELSRRKG